MPKIIVDENIPRAVRAWLTKKGFDTVNISQIHLKAAKDYAIAEYAAENNLAIITLDRGFAQLYRMFQKGTLAVIIVKVKPALPDNIIEALNAAQQKINLKEIQNKNKLVIITKNKIRIIT